jgi:dTDP-glucose 4,6-dehydratase
MSFEKYILITGGCGFIGSNFVNYMVEKYPNYFFVSLDAMYYSASLYNLNLTTLNAKNFKLKIGNINEYHLIQSIIDDYHISEIIHFAAQSHVDNSFEDSLQYTDDNIKGTHTLLEVVRKYKPEIRFFHFSTDEVYGESKLEDKPKDEMSLLCPTNPYAASKAAAEMLVNAYHHSYKLKTIITRCNNVFGPNQYPEKLIPKFIQMLRQGQKCTIHGDGKSLRSFIHVNDVCNAMEIIMEKGKIGEIYNIGSDTSNELTVLEVAQILIQKIKPQDRLDDWITFVNDRPYNDKRYFISNEKLVHLGWEQKIKFVDGLTDLLEKN